MRTTEAAPGKIGRCIHYPSRSRSPQRTKVHGAVPDTHEAQPIDHRHAFLCCSG
ncbi:hypothetical protein FM104_11525 [Microbacterium esteraromaticum]|uniref:Uncharacterized protein n=1 Tax=Microbacterium esteraromaticum TaxID=57043 RepID=A0A1R4KBD1_9MICO|nr:hypothetical protein FM104_11525 [Microbacterium esteraromaticum]